MPALTFDPVRSPRIQLLVNGSPAAGCYAATVESTAHMQAARWTAEVAVGAGVTAADWSALPAPSTVEIRGSLDGNNWTSLVTGDIDDLHLDIENGVVSLSGRDLSARFLDTKTSNAWPNSTSSQIATYLAGLRGLQANVIPTSTPVGQYYQLEHSRVTAGSFSKFSNEWELLCYLAREENYVVSVSGQTLNFVPRTQAGTVFDLVFDASRSPPVSVASNLQLSRSMTLAKDIKVVVRSWDSKKAAAHEVTATRSRTAGDKRSGDTQTYTYTKPGMTPQAAQVFANHQLAQLSQHEKICEFDIPGELQMSPFAQISLTGTGTAFDQTYYVDSITRGIDLSSGFHQHVRAKNSDPASQVAPG